MQYGVKLSREHPSETNYNFKNSYLKSIIFLDKNWTFYNIPIKIKIFRNQNNICLKDIENLAIILVPLIMIFSRGHAGQIKG